MPQRCERVCKVDSQGTAGTCVKELPNQQWGGKEGKQKIAGTWFTQTKIIHLAPKTNKTRDDFEASRDAS